jgi:peptidoglycan hydrolase CwlO-like protein
MAEPKDESLVQHILRAAKNCFTSCSGGIQTVDEKASIQVKNFKIEALKKKFGVDYMNLVKNHASEDQLEECVRAARASMEELETEIKKLEDNIHAIDAETQAKLIKKSGNVPSTPTTPTAAATPTEAATTTPMTTTVNSTAGTHTAAVNATTPVAVTANAPYVPGTSFDEGTAGADVANTKHSEP